LAYDDAGRAELECTDKSGTSQYLEGATEVFAIARAWKNHQGDIVTYFFRYEVRPPGAQPRQLRVKAVLASAATVEELRRALNPRKM
jgi:hypothetical protein